MAPIKTPMRLDISPLFLLCRLGAYLEDMRIFLYIAYGRRRKGEEVETLLGYPNTHLKK